MGNADVGQISLRTALFVVVKLIPEAVNWSNVGVVKVADGRGVAYVLNVKTPGEQRVLSLCFGLERFEEVSRVDLAVEDIVIQWLCALDCADGNAGDRSSVNAWRPNTCGSL